MSDLSTDATAAPEPEGSRARPAFFRFVPAFASLRDYSWRAFRGDLLAGLTVAAVSVPQSMGYALVVGLPPAYGLYTAIVITGVGALFNSSRHLLKGPTNALAIALMSALAFTAVQDRVAATVLMALMVGVIQIVIALLRFGDLTRYISHAVIVGFLLGANVLLGLDQLKNLVGWTAQGGPHDHFLQRFWVTMRDGGPIHAWTAFLGALSILIVLLFGLVNRRLRPGLRVPEFLLALLASSVLVWWLDLAAAGVQVVGAIPRHLPGFMAPLPEWRLVREMSGSALAIALLGLLEAIAMSKALAAQTGQKIDINQQGLSEGIANVAGSFFQCFPGSGSLSRSTINKQAGAATQWSGVIAAVAVATTILLFAPLARYVPRASLASILLVAAWRTIDPAQVRYHLRATRFDASLVLATALAAVLISVEFCILIGVFLSFLFYVPRAARLHRTELTVTPERVVRERQPGDSKCERILLYSFEGEFSFGSAPDLEEHLAAVEEALTERTRVVLLRLKRVRNPDSVCLRVLDGFVKLIRARGVALLLCGVRPDLASVLDKMGVAAALGAGNVFLEASDSPSSTLDAVRHAYELVGDETCPHCPRRQEGPREQEVLYYMI